MDGQRSLGGVAIVVALGIFGLSSTGILQERVAAASFALAAVALVPLAAVFMCWRAGLSSTLFPIAVATICFGALAYRWLTPNNALRPEIGALVVAASCGAASYLPWRGVSRRWERA